MNSFQTMNSSAEIAVALTNARSALALADASMALATEIESDFVQLQEAQHDDAPLSPAHTLDVEKTVAANLAALDQNIAEEMARLANVASSPSVGRVRRMGPLV